MSPGTKVRILRPDRPEHGTGVVASARRSGFWDVWVKHHCDCWTKGTMHEHIRGYDQAEVVEA